ncbi:unnamed protein product [Prorocentrum cordatum]|uniref:Uncharacterized protein n=1 Tax=Prorocentrum cordatum TaxID=2364126 RepID=A0ABN9S320_9DINO|nr:unnamed protein product [Polarella glacialis]
MAIVGVMLSAFRLRGASLAPPNPLAGARCGERGLVPNPGEGGRPGGTGITDESVALDQPARRPLRAALKAARPGSARPRHFEVAQARGAFNRAAERLGLEAQPPRCALRHSAASDDLPAPRRALSEVKDRGRWATDCSLRRSAKRAELQRQMNSLSEEVVAFGQKTNPRLASIFESAALQRTSPWDATAIVTSSSPGHQRPALAARWAAI